MKHLLKCRFLRMRHQIALLSMMLVLLSASISSALTLTNTSVSHGTIWQTFVVDAQTRNWYTEYSLTSLQFGTLEAFCVQNVTVDSNQPYSLEAVPNPSSQMAMAMLVAGNYFHNQSFTYSQTATQIAIWEIMFDGGLDLSLGQFRYSGSFNSEVNAILSLLNNEDEQLQFYSPVMLAHSPGSQDFLVAAPIPEPATMLLFGLGMLGIGVFSRRKLFGR